jgi:hypothetical protein
MSETRVVIKMNGIELRVLVTPKGIQVDQEKLAVEEKTELEGKIFCMCSRCY